MRNLFATTAIATMLALPAYADTDTTKPMDNAAAESQPMMSTGSMDIMASNLLGKSIFLPGEGETADELDAELTDAADTWERAGEIGDVILSKDGQIKSVTMDIGGFLGMGEKVVDASLDSLKFIEDADDEGEFFIVYTGDRSKLEEQDAYDAAAAEAEGDMMYTTSESFKASEASMTNTEAEAAEAGDTKMTETKTVEVEPLEETEAEIAEADAMKAEEAETAEAEAMETEKVETAETDEMQPVDTTETQTAAASEWMQQFTADELEGMTVYGRDGEDVGEVEQIILSDSGEIENIIVDVGGFLGLGEKPVAVSLDRLLAPNAGSEGEERRLTVDHTLEELENMEAWSDS